MSQQRQQLLPRPRGAMPECLVPSAALTFGARPFSLVWGVRGLRTLRWQTKAEREGKKSEREAEMVERQLERERVEREKKEAEDKSRRKEKGLFKGFMKVW